MTTSFKSKPYSLSRVASIIFHVRSDGGESLSEERNSATTPQGVAVETLADDPILLA